MGGGQLSAGQDYTVAVKVRNPAKFRPPTMNFWSVVIRDSISTIQDATYQVQGLELRSLKLFLPDQVSYERKGTDVYMVRIPIEVGHDLIPGSLSRFVVTPPTGFGITGNSSSPSLPIVSTAELENQALVFFFDIGSILRKG